ncbi:hypothetical protein Pmani_036458 [Petrolisthes manimaculis]|uniref:Uncharacterized protein n=1 Tax=Petrolisthes manimaculis TaxID=1843537 RepID=A0AAE1TPD7_9EUCA|nr:hypothetical protein Pmani_036458 [Petrolisthes manimaculis]
MNGMTCQLGRRVGRSEEGGEGILLKKKLAPNGGPGGGQVLIRGLNSEVVITRSGVPGRSPTPPPSAGQLSPLLPTSLQALTVLILVTSVAACLRLLLKLETRQYNNEETYVWCTDG